MTRRTLQRVHELRAAYDAQLRDGLQLPPVPGEAVERDGPLIRRLGRGPRGFVLYRDLGGVEGAALDELIARQVAIFASRGELCEWKLHGHDLPTDLPDRLRAAGFVADESETGTILVAEVGDVAAVPRVPHGVVLRDVTNRRDFERIAALGAAVLGEDLDWLPGLLAFEQAADPEGLTVSVAEAGGTVVGAAWIRFHAGTDFATLWGGATAAEWRRRGIYRAIVAHRANLAAARGFRYLATDASDDSRPILEQLGFVPVTSVTPYERMPPPSEG